MSIKLVLIFDYLLMGSSQAKGRLPNKLRSALQIISHPANWTRILCRTSLLLAKKYLLTFDVICVDFLW